MRAPNFIIQLSPKDQCYNYDHLIVAHSRRSINISIRLEVDRLIIDQRLINMRLIYLQCVTKKN